MGRTRERLTEDEVEQLVNAARKNRWGHRDATLRASSWWTCGGEQVDFRAATLPQGQVGKPRAHPILGDELRALRRRR